MTLITPPTAGEGVTVLAPHTRLVGHVTHGRAESLTVELEPTPIRRPFRFPPGARVEIEWTHEDGVMQLSATVGSSSEAPRPTLELRLVGDAEPVERREHDRVPTRVGVSAWSLTQPTRRIHGMTVDLSVAGGLLELPDLSPLSATLELWFALPPHELHVPATVRWRGEPGLVGVEFGHIEPDEQARLVAYLRRRH